MPARAEGVGLMALSKADPSHVVSKLGAYQNPEYEALLWRCAGCGDIHNIRVGGDSESEPGWIWNRSLVQPTLSPSILKQPNSPNPDFPGADKRCHSYVRDGRVEFLGDCDHDLAGKTVPMEPSNAWPFADDD